MNRYLTITILASITFGCGDNSKPATWGDGVSAISEAFCEARVRCGVAAEASTPNCIDHNINGLCERWDCLEELDRETEDMFEQCESDLEVWTCGLFLPTSCYAVLELRQ